MYAIIDTYTSKTGAKMFDEITKIEFSGEITKINE
jgi:hypothetical protein